MDILTSKSFYAAVVALLFVFFGERAGLTVEQVTQAVGVIMAYIVNRGLKTLGAESPAAAKSK